MVSWLRWKGGSSHLNAAFLSSSLEWPDRLNIEPVLGRGNIASEREGQSDCMSIPKLSQTTSYLDTGYLGSEVLWYLRHLFKIRGNVKLHS